MSGSVTLHLLLVITAFIRASDIPRSCGAMNFNTCKSAKSHEIHKNTQNTATLTRNHTKHVSVQHTCTPDLSLLVELFIPALNSQIYQETSSLQQVSIQKQPGVLRLTLRKTGHSLWPRCRKPCNWQISWGHCCYYRADDDLC